MRRPRWYCAALAALAALAASAAPASAAGLPPQGVYEGCAPGTAPAELRGCVDRLRTIRAAGFTIVLNYSGLYGSPEQVREYAAAAGRLGIRLIWPLHHQNLYSRPDVSGTFPAMTRACGCTSPRELIPFMVGVVRDAPATFMYYVGDETPRDKHVAMAANSRLVAQSDPSHLRFYVSAEQAGFGANLEPFAGDADVLAGDTYPVGTTNRLADVGDAARAVQRVADAHGRQAAMVLQAFSWGPDFAARPERWPTRAEYRAMRDAALTNGRPRFLLWWAAYVIFRSPDAGRHWADLAAAAMSPAPEPPVPVPSRRVGEDRSAVPAVRRASAVRRGRVVHVRFALTRAARTTVIARYGHKRRRRTVTGTRRSRTVRLKVAPRGRRVSVRVRPAGGHGVLLKVRRARRGPRAGAGARGRAAGGAAR
jgi:hypothetical protein